jgi:1,4-alpha-glucan branching enzyme
MAASQANINQDTPMGASFIAGGVTFRAWAPAASAVYICYDGHWGQGDENLLVRDERGYWAGFIPNLNEGVQYKFFIVGGGSRGFKRDPYARELAFKPDFPASNCIIRDSGRYEWHDQGFRPPEFSDLIIYQYHVGTFYNPTNARTGGRFLDILDKIDYLVALGVNAIQPLPISEFPTQFSMGYNGTDMFSPESLYAVSDDVELNGYLLKINAMLARRSRGPIEIDRLRGSMNQLKAMVDVAHVYGMAVIFDVVYNHAGGGFDGDSIYFFDREPNGNNNNSQFFTDQGWAGGLIFAFWKQEVRQFLIDNASQLSAEYHLDGFRYDEVSVITDHSTSGWGFCQDLTSTLRRERPASIQIAEHWPVDAAVVRGRDGGGAGFDSTWDDGLRESIRAAIGQAAGGAQGGVDMDGIASHLRRQINPQSAWRGVEYIESHDEVYAGRSPRIPRLADGANSRSWYARSRSRVASGILLTAPGIPMLFMGQEFLEDKQWSDNPGDFATHSIWWGGVDGGDKAMADYLRFTADLIHLRSRYPAFRGNAIDVFHVNNGNRIIAHHRWLEGVGGDVVTVISLNESTFFGYSLGFPIAGLWHEVFNSDVYDNWVNPQVRGNGGSITASGPPLHGLPSSAPIVIPANSIIVFARDL